MVIVLSAGGKSPITMHDNIMLLVGERGSAITLLQMRGGGSGD